MYCTILHNTHMSCNMDKNCIQAEGSDEGPDQSMPMCIVIWTYIMVFIWALEGENMSLGISNQVMLNPA